MLHKTAMHCGKGGFFVPNQYDTIACVCKLQATNYILANSVRTASRVSRFEHSLGLIGRGAALILFPLTESRSGGGRSTSSPNTDRQSDALRGVAASSHGGCQAHCKQQAEKTQMIDVCYVLLLFIPQEGNSFPILNAPLYFQNSNAVRELH